MHSKCDLGLKVKDFFFQLHLLSWLIPSVIRNENSIFLLSVCVHVQYVCVHMLVEVLISSTFPLPYSSESGSQSNPELTDRASLTSKLVPRSTLSLPSKDTNTGGLPCMPSIYMSSGESEFWSPSLYSKCFNHGALSPYTKNSMFKNIGKKVKINNSKLIFLATKPLKSLICLFTCLNLEC